MRTRLDLLVLSALGLYRVWRFVARDTITARPRELLYNRWPPNPQRASGTCAWNADLREMVLTTRPTRNPRPKVSMVSAGVDCPWCAGVWLAGGATLVVMALISLPWPVLWWLALSSAVGLLGRVEA